MPNPNFVPARPFEIRFRALTTDMSRIKAANAKVRGFVGVALYEFLVQLRNEIREYPSQSISQIEYIQKSRNYELIERRAKKAGVANPIHKPRQVYQRTRTLYRSWQISKPVLNPSGYNMRLTNIASDKYKSYAMYVQGEWQTEVHAQTGWIKVPDYVRRRDYRSRLRRNIQLIINDKQVQEWWREGRKPIQHPAWASKYSVRSHFLNPHYVDSTIIHEGIVADHLLGEW